MGSRRDSGECRQVEHAGCPRIRCQASFFEFRKPASEHHAGRDQPQEADGTRHQMQEAGPAHGVILPQPLVPSTPRMTRKVHSPAWSSDSSCSDLRSVKLENSGGFGSVDRASQTWFPIRCLMSGWIGMAAECPEFSPEPIDTVVLPEPANQK